MTIWEYKVIKLRFDMDAEEVKEFLECLERSEGESIRGDDV